MKRQIRYGVFETNSSSTHSLTMCSKDEYDAWEKGEVLYWEDKNKFGTREEIIEDLKNKRWYNGTLVYGDVNWDDEDEVYDVFHDERIQTCNDYFDDEYLECYEETYTTPSGDVIVAFGKFGHD